MKILLVHNKYQQAGGEDLVFESEGELLSRHNNEVERLVFDNREIESSIDKLWSGIRGIYNASSGRKLQEKINTFGPDIIHVHNFVPLASPSLFYVAKRNSIPVIATLHNYRLICPSATLFFNHAIYEKSVHALFPWDAITKGVYRNSRLQTAGLALVTGLHNLMGTWRNKVNKFIVLTDFARNKFINSSLRVSPDQLVLKPNFIVDPGDGAAERKNFFLFVGRLSEEKGIDTLLRAAAKDRFALTIIGDGPLREKVVAATKTNASLQYLGFQKKDVIFDYMKTCKALLFPSEWFEGFPMTILEAFATGTPVIASNLGSMKEIITPGVDGLLFAPGQEDELIRCLKEIQPADVHTKLSQQARARYLALYTPEHNYRMLMNIYGQVLTPAGR